MRWNTGLVAAEPFDLSAAGSLATDVARCASSSLMTLRADDVGCASV
jgi:hypothetical protein